MTAQQDLMFGRRSQCGIKFAHARRTYCSPECTLKNKRRLQAVAKVER